MQITNMASLNGDYQTSTDIMQTDRIPAWKRLGLKLKYAKEDENAAGLDSGLSSNALKRPTSGTHPLPGRGDSESTPATKKRRIQPCENDPIQSNGNLSQRTDPSPKPRGNSLKKSVSFTPETKLEDGDSTKTLHASWAESDEDYYSRKAAEHDAAEAAEAAETAFATSSHLGTPNRISNSKSKVATSLDAPRKSKDALDYLNLYHNSRASWKFSKNREVWILRHSLSTEAIPSSFNLALAVYIHGLKSDRAKLRLLSECQEILEKGESTSPINDSDESTLDSMEDPKRREAYQDDAIRRFKRSLEDHVNLEQRKADEEDQEYQRWLSRKRRAELLLWAVTPPTPSTAASSLSSRRDTTSERLSSTVSKSSNEALTNGVGKGRKNRTAIVDVSSSSEEESESSDEDDESQAASTNGIDHNGSDVISSSDESSGTESDVQTTPRAGSSSSPAATSSTHSSSSDGSDSDTRRPSGKRQQSAISISSRSNSSLVTASSTSDDDSESTALGEIEDSTSDSDSSVAI